MGAHSLYHPLSWRGLSDPIKLAYNPRCRKAGS